MSISKQGIQIVILDYYDTDAGVLKELWLTDGHEYTAMGVVSYPMLSKNFLFTESIFKDGTIFGAPDVGVGDLEGDNTSGFFDSYRFYGFDGQRVRVYQIQSYEEPLDDNINLLFTGTQDFPEFQLKTATFHVKNRLQEWTVAMQTRTFSGGLPDDLHTTLGPPIDYISDPADPEAQPPDFIVVYDPFYDGNYINRLEGEEGLAGKTKPMLFGRCFNIPLTCVNSSRGIFAFNYDIAGNRAPVYAIRRVYDQGVDILPGTDYPTAAAMIAAAAPAGGFYNSCLAESLIMFGQFPLGDATADIDEAPLALCTAAQVTSRILTKVLLYSQGQDFSQGELDALDALNACPVGIYCEGTEEIGDCIIQVLTSIGGWTCPDKNGVFRFGRIDLPQISRSVATFTNDNILNNSLSRVQTGDENRGIPAQKVTLRHTKVWSVLSKGQTLASVYEYTRTFMANEFRSSEAADPAVLTAHPSAPVISFDTLLVKGQRALIRNWDFLIPLGTVVSPKADWGNTSTGTATATIDSLNRLVLTPATAGQGAVHQALSLSNNTFSEGAWKFGFYFSGVNGSIQLQDGVYFTKVLNLTVAGDYSILVNFDLGGPFTHSLNIDFYNTAVDATGLLKAIFDNVYMQQILPGLTPKQEAARRLTILKSNFERFKFDLSIEDSMSVKIGDVCTVVLDDRMQMQDGKAFRIVGKLYDTDKNQVELDVVG